MLLGLNLGKVARLYWGFVSLLLLRNLVPNITSACEKYVQEDRIWVFVIALSVLLVLLTRS